MKILLVNKFHFLKGGSEQVYFATKELLEKKGHEVICFSMRHPKNIPCAQDDYFVREINLLAAALQKMKFIDQQYFHTIVRTVLWFC